MKVEATTGNRFVEVDGKSKTANFHRQSDDLMKMIVEGEDRRKTIRCVDGKAIAQRQHNRIAFQAGWNVDDDAVPFMQHGWSSAQILIAGSIVQSGVCRPCMIM